MIQFYYGTIKTNRSAHNVNNEFNYSFNDIIVALKLIFLFMLIGVISKNTGQPRDILVFINAKYIIC